MTPVKAVFWDMDGTIFNNEEAYEILVEDVMKRHGLIMPEGLPPGTCMNSLWSAILLHNDPKISFEDWLDEIITRCSQTLSENNIRPGILDTLQKISAANIPQTCVSNSMRHTIDTNFTKTGIRTYFEHLIGRDDVFEGKPAPHPYERACELHDLSPDFCFAIEDSEVGIISAKAAGLRVIAYPNNRTRHVDFSMADYIIENGKDIQNILKIS
ncbi:MAG: HAD family hydrolase [Candidatus Nucleicultricaceae bacterium]